MMNFVRLMNLEMGTWKFQKLFVQVSEILTHVILMFFISLIKMI